MRFGVAPWKKFCHVAFGNIFFQKKKHLTMCRIVLFFKLFCLFFMDSGSLFCVLNSFFFSDFFWEKFLKIFLTYLPIVMHISRGSTVACILRSRVHNFVIQEKGLW